MSTANNTTTPASPLSQTSLKKKDDDALYCDGKDQREETELTLRVKCNSPGIDSGDYEVLTNPSATVFSLKEAIREVIGPSARGRYLRVIASGRLLAPDAAALSDFKMQDGDCVHAVLAAAGVRGGQQAAMANGLHPSRASGRIPRFSRGVGISPSGLILPNPPSSDDSDDDLEAGRDRIGFDRLRSTGLSRDEIGAIRLYFSRHVDRYIAERQRETSEQQDDAGEEDDSSDEAASNRYRLRMEDEWMETQGPSSEFRLNLNTNNPLFHPTASPSLFLSPETDGLLSTVRTSSFVGTDRDFVWGFILGFFVGFIMLFWVWMPTVPHKQKLGILTGISFQLGLNLLRTMSTSGSGQNRDMV